MSAESKLAHVPQLVTLVPSLVVSVQLCSSSQPQLLLLLLLLQPHCCFSPTCCANLLLQSLQHTDQLAFKYVVSRVSELQAGPRLHRPAKVPAREAGSSGPAIRNLLPELPAGRNRASRGRFPAGAAALLLLLLTGFELQHGATHLFCKPRLRLPSSSWIVAAVANLVMFSNFALVM